MKIKEIRDSLLNEILDSPDGDYALQAFLLSKMKPAGW